MSTSDFDFPLYSRLFVVYPKEATMAQLKIKFEVYGKIKIKIINDNTQKPTGKYLSNFLNLI